VGGREVEVEVDAEAEEDETEEDETEEDNAAIAASSCSKKPREWVWARIACRVCSGRDINARGAEEPAKAAGGGGGGGGERWITWGWEWAGWTTRKGLQDRLLDVKLPT
jgi:hypothetical protein